MKKMNILLICLLNIFSFSCSKESVEPQPTEKSIAFELQSDNNSVTLTITESGDVASFDIWRSINESEFTKIADGMQQKSYVDHIENAVDNDVATYRVVAKGAYEHSYLAKRNQKQIRIALMSEDELMDIVQRRTLKYFYDFAHPDCKLARERSNIPEDLNVVTTGGTGFGIMALIAGAERNFISREQAFGHIRAITDFLMRVERFHGAYAHWYYGNTGEVKPFSPDDNGGDLVETSFLMQGLLTAKEYFSNETAQAKELKLAQDIDEIWREVEWNFYTQGEKKLFWHWSKDKGFKMNMPISGWNEGLMTYVLAASSPTYPIDRETYINGYCNNGSIKNGRVYYGIKLPLGNEPEMGGPLFFTHYSFLGLDPRNLSDDMCDNYYEQNRNHVLIDRAYCIANPKKFEGYSEDFWGLTASDCPKAIYLAHAPGGNDNGTVTPTGAISSMPYAPEECMQVMKNLYHNYNLFGEYGFYDAINLTVPKEKQIVKSFLAIDQGPIVVMLENHRSALLWNTFMKNQDVLNGLQKLGFSSPHIK